MAKGTYSNGSAQFFDSHAVEEFYGKFSGTFDLDESVAKDFQFDDAVAFLVTSRVDNSSFGTTRDGEIKRTNTFKVYEVVPVSAELYGQLMNAIIQSAAGDENAIVTIVRPLGEEVEDFDIDIDDEAELEPANFGMLVDDEEEEFLIAAEEEEFFTPSAEPTGEVVGRIQGSSFDVSALDDVDRASTAFTTPEEAVPVQRNEEGKDMALAGFLEEY